MIGYASLETLLGVLARDVGAKRVSVVPLPGQLEFREASWPPTDSEACSVPVAAIRVATFEWLADPVRVGVAEIDELPIPSWSVAVTPVAGSGNVFGALTVARRGSDPWTESQRESIRRMASVVYDGTRSTDPRLEEANVQPQLADLVARVATRLMRVSSRTLSAELDALLRNLVEFFAVDVGFVRRHEHEQGMSVLLAEWPSRDVAPSQDLLGVVSFSESDAAFAASENLSHPLVLRPSMLPAAYRDRIRQASGIEAPSILAVPLLDEQRTQGIIALVSYTDREWSEHEVNVLEVIASLLVQLLARVNAEEQLQYHAYHDELTGLRNRRAFVDELTRWLSDPSRDMVPLLFLDLDRFKTLNDSLGHTTGDRLLCSVAKQLQKATDPQDLVARLGGDEFVVVVANCADESAATLAASRILEFVGRAVESEGQSIARTGSIGVAMGQPGVTTADQLLGDADAALLFAKAQGGNRLAVFDEAMRARVERRNDIELHLREAIEHRDLRVYYQPEFDLRTGRVVALEALVRWYRPTRGLLTADAFIDVVEETSLINDLGYYVLAEACHQLAMWQEEYPELPLIVRVNVSPGQLVTRDIISLVSNCLSENDLAGERLCLEITERAMMHDVDYTIDILNQLRSLGVALAIDDFGTGFSSMGQLRRLPFDVIKIDQSFVVGLGVEPEDTAIVEAIVRLGRSFGSELVAEGVECIEVVKQLLRVGCNRAQGFLLAEPKPPELLSSLLARGELDGGHNWIGQLAGPATTLPAP